MHYLLTVLSPQAVSTLPCATLQDTSTHKLFSVRSCSGSHDQGCQRVLLECPKAKAKKRNSNFTGQITGGVYEGRS